MLAWPETISSATRLASRPARPDVEALLKAPSDLAGTLAMLASEFVPMVTPTARRMVAVEDLLRAHDARRRPRPKR